MFSINDNNNIFRVTICLVSINIIFYVCGYIEDEDDDDVDLPYANHTR